MRKLLIIKTGLTIVIMNPLWQAACTPVVAGKETPRSIYRVNRDNDEMALGDGQND
jgi:hypothetical protein